MIRLIKRAADKKLDKAMAIFVKHIELRGMHMKNNFTTAGN
ncbi:hypothetical protein X560_1491 [Listeria fleischmannii 1991]|uniref:Uncharacterized protein n=1 Tax=Listeria fleischmannii 1991 TaxID=1430899 RepID=A0A0J8GB28_9LIST|nr:hypothetical protein X560_1491 [Listeria fleischmannii 1991]